MKPATCCATLVKANMHAIWWRSIFKAYRCWDAVNWKNSRETVLALLVFSPCWLHLRCLCNIVSLSAPRKKSSLHYYLGYFSVCSLFPGRNMKIGWMFMCVFCLFVFHHLAAFFFLGSFFMGIFSFSLFQWQLSNLLRLAAPTTL